MESKIGMNGPTLKAPLSDHSTLLPKQKRKVHRLEHQEREQLIQEIKASGGDNRKLEQLRLRWDLSQSYISNLKTKYVGRNGVPSIGGPAVQHLTEERDRLRADNAALRAKIEKLMGMIDPSRLVDLLLGQKD